MPNEPLGTACPQCQYQGSKVSQTFKRSGNVRRRRRCTNPQCGHQYVTGEIVMNDCKDITDET